LYRSHCKRNSLRFVAKRCKKKSFLFSFLFFFYFFCYLCICLDFFLLFSFLSFFFFYFSCYLCICFRVFTWKCLVFLLKCIASEVYQHRMPVIGLWLHPILKAKFELSVNNGLSPTTLVNDKQHKTCLFLSPGANIGCFLSTTTMCVCVYLNRIVQVLSMGLELFFFFLMRTFNDLITAQLC
jgi:hypothetical protein